MKYNILIIDDDTVDQQVIGRALKKTGIDYKITYALTGTEVLNNYTLSTFDFMFIDYLLPGPNGVEMIIEIRNRNYIKPIVLITVNDDIGLAEKAIEAGATNYMTKDLIHPAGLLAIIRSSESINKYESRIKDLLFRQENILNATKTGTFEWDIEQDRIIVNNNCIKITGYTSEELKPLSLQTIKNLMHEIDFVDFKTILEKCINKEIEYIDYQMQLHHKTGKWIWVHFKGEIMEWSADRKGKKMFGTYHDITENKQHARKIASLKELLEQINTAAKIGTWELNLDNREVELSSVSREIFEIDELIDISTEKLNKYIKTGIDHDNLLLAIQNAIRKNIPFDLELEINTASGKEKWIRAIGITEYKDGKCKRIYGSFQDVNFQKRTQIELINAKEIAEKHLVAKDSFLANVSHEIRTPMNAVMGFSGLLLETNLNKDQFEFVNAIKTASENLLYIINDILDFSKIESGKIEIEHVPFNLKTSLKNVQQMFLHKSKEKNLDFTFMIDDKLPEYVIGDSVRLNQILINLVGNAFKFTNKGEITVFVKVIEQSDSNCIIKFSVKDTGIGIAKDKLNLIFERFTQAESYITKKYGGTGLGLNISKKLLELQNSELQLTSVLGKGSEFYFTINYGIPKTTELTLETIENIKIDTETGIKILLCEDNELNQKLAINVGNKFGFKIDVANTGAEGLDLLKKKKYDIVLMDLNMPEMGGIEASIIIRNELKMQIPIIAMTANVIESEKQKCFEIGMNDYILKPFKPNDLYKKITSLVSEYALNNSTKEEQIVEFENYEIENLDLSYLNELSDGDKDFEKDMIEMYLKQIPDNLNCLYEANKNSDFSLMQHYSHKLKSFMPVAGLDNLIPKLSSIEFAARELNITADTKNEIEEVLKIIKNSCLFLQNYLKGCN